jgi:hypothetical protein
MPEAKLTVTFYPVKIKVGSQWCVRVTFPYEVPQELFSFATEAEAQEWIARDSVTWLKLYRDGKYA